MSAEKYIRDLYEASGKMSDKEIRDAIDELAAKRIEEIRNTKTEVTVSGKKYYVSADGDDTNDGLSPESAWKTMKRVHEATELASGDGVFFRRGDVFRGNFFAVEGVTYSAYGEGAKPMFHSADKNYGDPAFWLESDVPHVWVLSEESELDIGNIVYNDQYYGRRIYRSLEDDGTQLDFTAGRVFNDYHDLVEDMSFFHDTFGDDKKLYLRCERGNPGELFEDIELTKRISIIRCTNKKNVTIDNLCFSNGNFGITAGPSDGLTVQNCEFKWIGGCIMKGPKGYSASRTWPTPYGNGIEIYGEARNFTVDNCYFRQAYDAAMTHQCGGEGDPNLHNKNIKYINNVVDESVYSIEIFYGYKEGQNRRNEDTLIANNILRRGGGFGDIARPDQGATALIRHGRLIHDTVNYVVKNNIFDRSKHWIVSISNPNDGASKAQYFDNIYVQSEGGKFCMRLDKKYTADENLGAALEETGTEHNPRIILADGIDF